MKATHSTVLMMALISGSLAPAQAGSPGGIGVLGDSYSDEYSFYPPDRSLAENWVEILAQARGLDFGPFSEVSRGEPRNQGYAYNWARSDAETSDLIATGQHLGLAEQVARGEVKVVVVFIGGNDFIHAWLSPDPAGRLREVLPRALTNFRTAVETILAADPSVKLVVGTVPDIRNLPEIASMIQEGQRSADLASVYTAAIRQFNAQVRSLADDPRIALVDLDLTTQAANLLSRHHTIAWGQKLDRIHGANDPEHFFLADNRHPGTLGQGLMAQMVVAVLDAKFAAGIEPLAAREVLSIVRPGHPEQEPRVAAIQVPKPEP